MTSFSNEINKFISIYQIVESIPVSCQIEEEEH